MTAPTGGPAPRVALLGGSFDPPHLGHLRLAELAWERLGLDALRFVPSAQPPHKAAGATPDAARLGLLRLALAGRPWSIDPLELDRGGTSYTVDTLEALAAREPGAAWILVLGSDQAAAFATWRDPARILELAAVAAALRPGQATGLPPILGARLRPDWSGAPGEVVQLPSTGLDLSSTTLREDLARGGSPAGLPAQVLAAIQAEALYR